VALHDDQCQTQAKSRRTSGALSDPSTYNIDGAGRCNNENSTAGELRVTGASQPLPVGERRVAKSLLDTEAGRAQVEAASSRGGTEFVEAGRLALCRHVIGYVLLEGIGEYTFLDDMRPIELLPVRSIGAFVNVVQSAFSGRGRYARFIGASIGSADGSARCPRLPLGKDGINMTAILMSAQSTGEHDMEYSAYLVALNPSELVISNGKGLSTTRASQSTKRSTAITVKMVHPLRLMLAFVDTQQRKRKTRSVSAYL
jgi:hypothetical protein